VKARWWVNYETGRYVALKCCGVDRESAILNLENQKWLGLSLSMIADIYRFKPVQDRDCLLLQIMKMAPLMRISGHWSYVIFEFRSDDEYQPLDAIRRWVRKNAGPMSFLNIDNFSSGQSRTVSVLPGQLDDIYGNCRPCQY
jgi:hypothetical protein